MIAIWLHKITGMSLFTDRLFRSGAAALFAWLFVMMVMPWFIRLLHSLDATADFDSERSRRAPPICGGLLLVAAVLLATFCFAIPNPYVISIVIILCAYTAIGGIDDWMKVRSKRLVASGKLEKKDYQEKADGISARFRLSLYFIFSIFVALFAYKLIPGLDGHLTVPFVKKELWYPYLPNWAFILLISFVTTASANGANFTDGLDSLVSIPLITTAAFVGSVAYISGNVIFADYLLLPHLPGVDELSPICAAIIGSVLAYLWFNSPPAEIYMGDGGSIGLGGAIGMMFVLIKAELFLPIVGVIFLAEAVSVVMQISFFKLTRRFSADHVGRRIFRRAPIHDHFRLTWKEKYQSLELATSKVIWRFHLVSVIALIVGALIFFKIR